MWVAEAVSTRKDLKILGSSSCRKGALKADWEFPGMWAWRNAVTTDPKERDLQHLAWEVQLLEENEQVQSPLCKRSAF